MTLKSSSNDNISIVVHHLIYKLVQRGHHYWDETDDGQDYPPLVPPVVDGLSEEEAHQVKVEFYERVDNAPPNTVGIELEYLLFRRVERGLFPNEYFD